MTIDPETGEVTQELSIEAVAAQAAGILAFMSQQKMLLKEIKNAITAAFPQRDEVIRQIELLMGEYESATKQLRELALEEYATTGATKFANGAISVAMASSVTQYDAQQALDWCDEMGHEEWITRTVDKKKIQAALEGGESIPPEVMTIERVAQTRLYENKLINLASEG